MVDTAVQLMEFLLPAPEAAVYLGVSTALQCRHKEAEMFFGNEKSV